MLVLASSAWAAPASAATPDSSSALAAPVSTSVHDHPTRHACALPGRGRAACHAIVRTDVTPMSTRLATSTNTTPSGYRPADLQSAYGLTAAAAAGGSGVIVAVIDAYNAPTAEADLAAYRAAFGLPPCTSAGANPCFRKVNQRGQASPLPAADSGWATEISLDLDMVSAICPNCSILLVEADSSFLDDLGAAVNYAVAAGAKYISNSYGGPEDGSSASLDTLFYKHPGVVITASTGDEGYEGYLAGAAMSGNEYPSVSPWVVAVGGTTLRTAANARGWTESAWSEAGSGCSVYEARPPWQASGLTACSRRMVADVSAVADPNTGVAAVYGGNWYQLGGTSASAPIVAAAYALAGTPAGGTWPVSYPYGHGGLNDPTGGNNAGGSCSPDPGLWCTGVVGYDGPTGLGTPNGTAALGAPGLPGAPTGITATPGSGSAQVVWSAPGSDGGNAITSYTAIALPGGNSCTWSAGPLACTVTGLSGGSSYTFTVRATNAVGTGPALESSSAVAIVSAPGAPTGVAGSRGDAQVAVAWSAPASSGGLPITGYTATASPGGASCVWTSGPLTCTVPGLANGTAYTFTVSASNAAGASPPSAASAPVTPSTVPGQPQAVAGTPGNAAAVVTWQAPASNGGAAVAAYTVTASPVGATCGWTSGPLTCTVSGLANGTPYAFSVVAANAAGTGPASDPSAPVTPRTVPGVPQLVAATPGSGSIAVTWAAPASDGGSAITGYTAIASPGGASCTWTGGPYACQIGGLANGSAYTITVTASNGAGTGLASSPPAAVTPSAPPGAPSGILAVAGNASAQVSWSAPADNGGSPVTGYTVTSNPDGRTCAWSSGPLECVVGGLADGTAYTFTVRAVNAAGAGRASGPSAAVLPTSVPGAPTGVDVVLAAPTPGALAVSWTAPDPGGSPISSYMAIAYLPGTNTVVGGCTSSAPLDAVAVHCAITGLGNGMTVVVRVFATNAAGTGLRSAPSGSATTPTLAVASVIGLPYWTIGRSFTLAWTGAPGTYGITSYQVRFRRAAWNGSFGSTALWRDTTATSATFIPAAGSTYCFSSRAVDQGGYAGPWSSERCTTTPLDDRSLSRSGRWYGGTGSTYFRSTWSGSSAYGARAVRTSVRAKQIVLVATSCPACGTVRVYLGSTLLRSISLYSATTINRRIFTVAKFTSIRSGTVTVKVSSSGRRVFIDGLGISRM